MSITVVCPPGDLWAGIAAQIEAGRAHVVQERRVGKDRRERRVVWEHGQRGPQRRQATPLPVRLPIVVTAP